MGTSLAIDRKTGQRRVVLAYEILFLFRRVHICTRIWTRHARPKRMRTNAKKLLVQRSPHKRTIKRSTGHSLATSTSVWLWTYFSLKYQLQIDSVCLFAKHTPHKRMKANAVCLLVHITHFARVSHLFCIRVQMRMRLFSVTELLVQLFVTMLWMILSTPRQRAHW